MHPAPALGRIMRRVHPRRHGAADQDLTLITLRSALAGRSVTMSDDEMFEIADRYWPELVAASDTRSEMTRLSSSGLNSIGRLAELAGPNKPLAAEARHRLCELALFAQERATGSSSGDDRAGHASYRARVWAYRQYLVSITLAIVVAVGCAVALAAGRPTIAVALFASRICLDLTSGHISRAPTDLHQSSVRESPLSFRARYFGCVGSHIGDLIAWTGFVVGTYAAGSAGWALVMAGLGALAVLGSLSRVGLSLIGVSADRRSAERWIRVGALFSGMVVVALGDPVLGGLIAIGPAAAFALFEGLRSCRAAWGQQATDVATLVRHAGRLDESVSPTESEMTCGVVYAPRPGARRTARCTTSSITTLGHRMAVDD
jgi:hypothetical protein